jgi:hypothetical protein
MSENLEIIEGEVVDEGESGLPAQVLPAANSGGRPNERGSLLVGEEAGLKLYADKTGEVFKETPRALRAFNDYVNMGRNRSLPKLAAHYVENDPEWTDNFESVLRILKGYSARFDWQNRIRIQLAADSAKIASRVRREALESSKERLRLYKMLQKKGEAVIYKALSIDLEDLSSQEARLILKQAIEMVKIGLMGERVEQGAALERVELHKPIDQYSDAELDEFIRRLQAGE